jgi:glycosyltransferase involved in cell wall biosynthesis
MLKILYLATSVFKQGCGISQQNRDFLNGLVSTHRVNSVYLLMRLLGEHQQHNNHEKITIDQRAFLGKMSFLIAAIRLALFGIDFDLIFCGHINLIPIAYVISRLKKAKVCLIVHGVEAWAAPRNLIWRYFTKKIDCFIAVSFHTRHKFVAWSRLEKGFVLHNPVDLNRFTPGCKSKYLINKYNIGNQKVIISLCRLDSKNQYKGIDEIIDIFPRLLKKNANLLYLIAGNGDDKSRLEKKVKNKKLSNVIKLIGFVHEKDKVNFYRLGDVFAMPGRGEGFGYVYLEAVACGIPTIGSQLDASKEALKNGEFGLVIDPDNSEALTDAILKALSMQKKRPAGLCDFGYENYLKKVNDIIGNM